MMKNIILYLFVAFNFLIYSVTCLAEDRVALNHLDLEYGDAGGNGGEDDDRFFSFSGSIYSKLSDKNYLQLDLERTHFDDVEMNEMTAYFIRRNDNSMLAVGYKRQELEVFKSNHAIFQYQYYQDDLLTIVGSLGHDDKNISDDRTYGSLYLRIYPYENLMIQTGPSFNDSFKGDFGSEDVELDFGVEWRPGIESIPWLSFYYQENVFGDVAAGIRFRVVKDSLINIHRSGGILGI